MFCMENCAYDADKAKFPGVFVRHKGHKDPVMVTHPKKLEHLGTRALKSDSELESPKSNHSEVCEEFAISSCTSSCSVTTTSAQAVPQKCHSVSSECGMTMSDSEAAASSTDDLDGSRTDSGKLRRSKRKKGKDKAVEENTALDPVRYKTKMCKNWQMLEKCPYGPRCLFAHGTKEMRTYNLNHNAISTASSSSSPERQFYALGHFPNFMPVPFNAAAEETEEKEVESVEPIERTESTTSAGQYTHSPYSSIIMEQGGPQQQQYAADCVPPPVMGPLQDPYFFHHRPFHPQMPMFPQMPFPSDCAVYAPQYPHLPPYQVSSEVYPLSYFQPVR